MATIGSGAAKVTRKITDLSQYAASVGDNILAVVGVFQDGDVENGNLVTDQPQLAAIMGNAINRYNSATTRNYAHLCAYTALNTISQVYCFRVTDGTEVESHFYPSGTSGTDKYIIMSKWKTNRWNDTVITAYKNPSFFVEGQETVPTYTMEFSNPDTGEIIESYEFSLVEGREDFLPSVINTNSLYFKVVYDSNLTADFDVEKFQKTVNSLDFATTDTNTTVKVSIRTSTPVSSIKIKEIDDASAVFASLEEDGLTFKYTANNTSVITALILLESFVTLDVKVVGADGEILDKSNPLLKTIFLKSHSATSELTVTTDNKLSGGLSGSDSIALDGFINAIDKLKDTSKYDMNLVVAPGITNPAIHKAIDAAIVARGGDALQIYDIDNNVDISDVIRNTQTYNSYFMTTYYPWVEMYDPFMNSTGNVPPSCQILEMYGNNDEIGEQWYAPAGLTRGRLLQATNVSRSLTSGERDTLQTFPNIVNPIVIEDGGVTAWGNYTSYRISSKLREISVIRLIINLTKVFVKSSKMYLFEPNTTFLWDQWKLQTKAVMTDILNRQGVYDFSVQMGLGETMSDLDVDRNIAKGVVRFKPVGYAHEIALDFQVLSSGAATTNITI